MLLFESLLKATSAAIPQEVTYAQGQQEFCDRQNERWRFLLKLSDDFGIIKL